MKQLNLFSKQELKNLGRKINTDLATKQITDEALKKILPKLQLVSSKQLATILSKKNDNSLRAQRCMNIGFTWYKDSRGKIYYNLPEVMQEIGVGIAE
jgi:hypothetical protein|tara:strand:+ start:2245 stop:2538 length:294 start_codon:yes stop_codon:yes gene_type:complete